MHTDGDDFLNQVSHNYYIDNYLKLVEQATKELDIPVKLVHCLSMGSWIDYVDRFSDVGAMP